jgi:hypothetical protein
MEMLHLTEREGTSIIFNAANITYIKSSNAGVKIGTADGKEFAIKEPSSEVMKMLEGLRK